VSTDADVIRRSITEPSLFEEVFDRHYGMICGFAQRRVGVDDGEEIAAATFELAFTQRARFDGQTFSSARPWLLGIASNLIHRHIRRADIERRNRPVSLEVPVPPGELGLEALDAERRAPVIRAALAELSEADRETFLLVVLGELSYAEVAAVVAVPIGTVRSRVNRSRRILRELLTQRKAINPWEDEQGIWE
jgi:RNA polymerase sigma factor (sigma-70 family)